MVAVKGIFDGKIITLLEKVEAKKNSRVVVTFLDEIDSVDEVRAMTTQSNGFDFWTDSKEDIYQDFLPKKENENG
jgi:septation ring formation regulator EzrA